MNSFYYLIITFFNTPPIIIVHSNKNLLHIIQKLHVYGLDSRLSPYTFAPWISNVFYQQDEASLGRWVTRRHVRARNKRLLYQVSIYYIYLSFHDALLVSGSVEWIASNFFPSDIPIWAWRHLSISATSKRPWKRETQKSKSKYDRASGHDDSDLLKGPANIGHFVFFSDSPRF